MSELQVPREYAAFGRSLGIKPKGRADFGAVFSRVPAVGTAIFTQNRYPGHPIIFGRRHAEPANLRAVVVNSGNSNVATGPEGARIVEECLAAGAKSLGVETEQLLPCSTGVIGRLPPRDTLVAGYAELGSQLNGPDFEAFAAAIMTTDTFPKLSSRALPSGARVLGIAKGAGMIEPDMATMLSYAFTDAALERDDLRRLIRCVANRTFNRVSIDGDTSTSDTFAIIANGASGVSCTFTEDAGVALDEVADPFAEGALAGLPLGDDASRELVAALLFVCRDLTRMIARDGEGGSKLIELAVTEAATRAQALKVGRRVINSPLFKTAVRGADPNWGRIIMAIGNVRDEAIPLEGLRIEIGGRPLDMRDNSAEELARIAEGLRGPEVHIRLSLGTGSQQETLWGCDLTEDYVRVNAYYTT